MLGIGNEVRIVGGVVRVLRRGFSSLKRQSSALILRISGRADYTVGEGASFTALPGDVVFVGEGEVYSVRVRGSEECRYGIIYFHTDVDLPAYDIFRCEDVARAHKLILSIIEESTHNTERHRLLALSRFYELLSLLAPSDARDEGQIAPALEYLDAHIYDDGLTVDSLAMMSGMSDVYFRRLFMRARGVTPKQYITERRMRMARTLIESYGVEHIYEAAQAVGYTDPLYFSRVFKKFFGITPREARSGKTDKSPSVLN